MSQGDSGATKPPPPETPPCLLSSRRRRSPGSGGCGPRRRPTSPTTFLPPPLSFFPPLRRWGQPAASRVAGEEANPCLLGSDPAMLNLDLVARCPGGDWSWWTRARRMTATPPHCAACDGQALPARVSVAISSWVRSPVAVLATGGGSRTARGGRRPAISERGPGQGCG
jgi:hypothetical protein